MTDRTSILIVEDHLETRTFLDLALSDDYSVDTATSAAEALDKTEQNSYDLLLVDIALRDRMDGMQLVETLRQKPAYAQTPMIAMTAHQLRDDRDHYLRRGFDDFLGKPFYPEDLLDAIERHLEKARRGDEPRTGA